MKSFLVIASLLIVASIACTANTSVGSQPVAKPTAEPQPTAQVSSTGSQEKVPCTLTLPAAPSINATQDNACDQVAEVGCYDMFRCCSEGEREKFLGVTDPRSEAECRDDLCAAPPPHDPVPAAHPLSWHVTRRRAACRG